MKSIACIRAFLVFANLFLLTNSFSQTFLKKYSTDSDFEFTGIDQTIDNGFVITGSINIENITIDTSNKSAVFLQKTNSKGELQWTNYYNMNNEKGGDVKQTKDGGYLIFCNHIYDSVYFGGQILSQSRLALIKTDKDGRIKWAKKYQNFAFETSKLLLTSDGGILICGNGSYFNQSITPEFVIIKLNSSGDVQWSRNCAGGIENQIYDIVQDSEDGYILVGYDNISQLNDFWGTIIRIDDKGNIVWDVLVRDVSLHTICKTRDHNYIIGGSKIGNTSDALIIKIDIKSNVIWSSYYDGGIDEHLLSIDIDRNDEIISLIASKNSDSKNDLILMNWGLDGINGNWVRNYGHKVTLDVNFNHEIGNLNLSDDGYLVLGNNSVLKTDKFGAVAGCDFSNLKFNSNKFQINYDSSVRDNVNFIYSVTLKDFKSNSIHFKEYSSCYSCTIEKEQDTTIVLCGKSDVKLNSNINGKSYRWSTGEQTQMIVASNTGTYWVEVSDTVCSVRDTITVKKFDRPSLGDDAIICGEKTSVNLSVNPAWENINWSNASKSRDVFINKTGDYFATVSNDYCTLNSDTIHIEVILPEEIFIPNLISNNQDQLNDCFEINSKYPSRLTIYNRWGSKVFESENYKNDWCPQSLDAGVYFYSYEPSCQNKIEGWVELIK